MKTLATILLTALCAAPVMAATVTGVVTDDMCGPSGKHMMPGKPDAVCVRECVKAGAKYALSSNGKLYILAGQTKQVDALAGQKATVTGDLSGNTLSVKSITAAK